MASPLSLIILKLSLSQKKHISMRDIRQITSTELLALKHQYDKDFLRYWRRPDGSSKFKPISIDAFKSRFFKAPQEGLSNLQNTKSEIWYCDTCGASCKQNQVIAGFGFCNNCTKN
jgi:hypothetical protein